MFLRSLLLAVLVLSILPLVHANDVIETPDGEYFKGVGHIGVRIFLNPDNTYSTVTRDKALKIEASHGKWSIKKDIIIFSRNLEDNRPHHPVEPMILVTYKGQRALVPLSSKAAYLKSDEEFWKNNLVYVEQ